MTMSTGRARNEASRAAILAAARTQLVERGWNSFVLERVASEARVGKQTIYRWWPSKADLVAEAVLDGDLFPTGDVPDSGDVRADFTEWLRFVRRTHQDPAARNVIQALIAAIAENQDLSDRYENEVTRPALAHMALRLRRARAAGEIPAAVDADLVAQIMLSSVLTSLVTRRPFDDAFAARLVAATLH